MNVLSFSYCFPHARAPAWGVFVERRLAALARRPGVELQVVSPVPSFPLVTRWRRGSVPAQEQWNGLTVHRPRFFSVPGVLKSLDAKFYARGLRRTMEARCQVSGVRCQEGEAGDRRSEKGDGDPLTRTTDCLSAPLTPDTCHRTPGMWRPDVLDAHFIWPDGVAVALLARRLGIPYVLTLRGVIYLCMDVAGQRRQCIEALRGAAAVISVDGRMARLACELGVPPEQVHVIPNGADLDRFRPSDQLDARRRLGLPEQGRLLVTVAHLGVRKGHREALAALARLPDDVGLVLVGDELRRGDAARLRRVAASLGVGHRLWLAGSQPPERVPDYFAAADAGLLASYREGCPNAVLECLACGRPVVATDVGAVPDMVVPGRNGEIVPPRDSEALAAALRKALGRCWNPEDVRRGVKSWDEVAEQVHQVLDATCQPGCWEFDDRRAFRTGGAEFSAE